MRLANWIKTTFKGGDPVRDFCNPREVNALRLALAEVQGVGMRWMKTRNGRGWLTVIDGASDVNYPPGEGPPWAQQTGDPWRPEISSDGSEITIGAGILMNGRGSVAYTPGAFDIATVTTGLSSVSVMACIKIRCCPFSYGSYVGGMSVGPWAPETVWVDDAASAYDDKAETVTGANQDTPYYLHPVVRLVLREDTVDEATRRVGFAVRQLEHNHIPVYPIKIAVASSNRTTIGGDASTDSWEIPAIVQVDENGAVTNFIAEACDETRYGEWVCRRQIDTPQPYV